MAQPSSTPLVAPTAQAAIARPRVLDGVTIGIISFFAISLFTAFVIDKTLSPFGYGFSGSLGAHYTKWLRSLAWVMSGGRAWAEAVPAYWNWARYQPGAAFGIIYFTASTSTAVALGTSIWLGLKVAEPRDPNIHIRGRQIRRKAAAEQLATQVSREKCAISKPEIKIHDSIVLARHQVMQSFMVMGAQGGGKTQILWRFVLSLIHQGWKTVIFDLAKGDYTISTPNVHRLFALGDARSSVWSIWRDVKTLADAESFARGLITESSDPMWSNAARGVCIAMIMRLINEKGQEWRWKDLGETVFADAAQVKEFAQRYYPPAVASVADAESKTTQSIIINLSAYLAPLYRFAEEWADLPENFSSGKPRAFSWIEWLEDDNSADRNVILQSNAKDKTSATALIRAMMEVQVSHIASLEFSESKTRSIFYMLDELPQVGRLECLPTIMEVGRSKGCAVGLAFQDIAQIRQIYKPGEDDKWLAMLGVRIFAQVKGAASGKFVLDQIGNREIARPTNNVSYSVGGYSVSNGWQHTEVPVMTADELEKLGPQPNNGGINAIVLGHGTDVLELNWPFYSPPEHRKARVARVRLENLKTPETRAKTENSATINVAETPDPVTNTDQSVNVIEQNDEAPDFSMIQNFNNAETQPDASAFANAESPETSVNTEKLMVIDVAETFIDIPIFDNTETQNYGPEADGVGETVADEIAQHVISEAVSDVLGVSPEAVEMGLGLLDEIGVGGNSKAAVTEKVMTPAQMRKRRIQEREAQQ
jgi:hypothetical protein